VDTLESFRIGARLGRGKSYARQGQVLSIEIEKGRVNSKVQGSRSTPYSVGIEMKTFKASVWKNLAKSLMEQPYYTARLIAGEIPEDFEDVLKEAGTPLFPEQQNDLKTGCTCPDWSNPCKHIAAVYYLLAEEFDRDPFLLFELRGITREELLYTITGQSIEEQEEDHQQEMEHASIPLLSDDRFWQQGALPDDLYGKIRTPPASASLVKRLGKFPFWRAQRTLIGAMEPVFQKASTCGLEILHRENL